MRNKLKEIFKKNETVINWEDSCQVVENGIEESVYDVVIDEIEKLFESHIKTGVVESYDKSKFKIFPTWKETKEVSEISEEVFLGFVNNEDQCNGFEVSNGFRVHCTAVTCYECILDSENSKAEIVKWMEATK